MLSFAKILYSFFVILIAVSSITDAAIAQAPIKQDQKSRIRTSQNDVSITISVTRPSLSQASNEAREIQETMPKALFKIFHKDVKINYAPTKVTTKIDKFSRYQVTVVGTGKS